MCVDCCRIKDEYSATLGSSIKDVRNDGGWRGLTKADACGRGGGGDKSQMQTSAFGIILNVKKEELYPTHCFYYMSFLMSEQHYTNNIL